MTPSATSTSTTNMESSSLQDKVHNALSAAAEYAFDLQRDDGHWCGELKANATITAEQVMILTGLQITISKKDAEQYRRYFLNEQQSDGSWSLAPDYPGDVSVSCEAYLALRILGLSADSPQLKKARKFILAAGGVSKVRMFTRLYFAQFGLFPWEAVPELPAELILVPSSVPGNIYNFASWARATVIPMLIISHHKPTFPLPNGARLNNDFIDELWCNPNDKIVPLPSNGDAFSFIFKSLDSSMRWLGGLRRSPSRTYALNKCVEWMLERQEVHGDWGGTIPPMHSGVYALILQGYKKEDDCIRRALEAIDAFHWEDEHGKSLQACVSCTWDTVLMTRGICDSGVVSSNDERLQSAMGWALERQHKDSSGDWRVYAPAQTPAGGFPFGIHNTWYQDTDDTAAAILSMLSQDTSKVSSEAVDLAVLWICGMQSQGGGWAAFDINNTHLWLNKIPFSDMDAMCDPPTSDLTGRILECFGSILQLAHQGYHVAPTTLAKMVSACKGGLQFLVREQEANGAWWGRWGSNYIYGTSNALCGLTYFEDTSKLFGFSNGEGAEETRDVSKMMARGAQFLKLLQNDDGGWGESLDTYRPNWKYPYGPSTPSQSAWALMGLMALSTSTAQDEAIKSGVQHLLDTQADKTREGAASWPETLYTGIGFPNHFYLGYTMYRHYFPMMALGRYRQISSERFEKSA